MAKRTKKSKSSRSNLRVETLEQRQLLATIVAGSGTEVASNVQLPQGTYDQILMTGASVTVSADPGEVVRVSFLDQGGDIVQAEFGGAGTMTVSLEDVKTAASAGYVNKNPDQFLNGNKINYIQGLATITVDKPELNSNLGVYAAGILQNPGFFTGQAKQGDNGLADVARVILVGNPNNEAGYSNMGGIRMGGAVFSATSGVVGIRGENVAIQNIVAIGDIDAKESGVPTLMFNTNTQIQTVFVRGGDLRQSNGASFNTFGGGNGGAPGGSPGNPNNNSLGGFSFFNSTDGTTSQNVKLWATPVSQDAIRNAAVDQQTLISGDWVYDWTNPQAVKVTQNGVDVSSVFGGDWLAKGGVQASLDYAFERRTFDGAITIKGDLPAGIEMNLADARSNITFENNLFGTLAVNGYGAGIDGTLNIMGNLNGIISVKGFDRALGGQDGQMNKINSIVVGGSTGAFTFVSAEEIGDVTIRNNFSGIITTDFDGDGVWDGTSRTTTTYVDYEGKIGNVSVGYNAAGASTGGSIINGTIQGMSGIGNVRVGGDIYGTSERGGVFVTQSNSLTASGTYLPDTGAYGRANIGTLDVRGDVDLDNANANLILIGGHGTFGNINVQGLTTTNTVPGPQTGTKTDLIPGSESFVRILSPFTDVGFVTDPTIGQKLVQNYDPDGVAGALNDTYFVTKADVAAGAQIYDIATAKMVAAKEGDRVPALSGGLPIIDTFGNVLYRQNTALFEGKTQTVPVFGPDVVTIVSGNRGNLNGVFNNFGKITIAQTLGAQQPTTGTITWSDSVDMNFGGVTVNSSGTSVGGVIGVTGTVGQITINNTSGATSDLIISGQIGSAAGAAGGNNASTAFVSLAGITSGGFEDVRINGAIRAVEIKNGISINTVTGVGNGTGVGTVSPSVVFNNVINLDDGTNEGSQKALLAINTGMVNSTIGFTNAAGITVDNGATTGNGSEIEALSLSADYVYFNGTLQANKIGALTLTGGKGIGSTTDTGVSFIGNIRGDTVGAITGSASEGNVVFAPAVLTGLSTKGTNNSLTQTAEVASITLTTAGTNNGGDITLGNSSLYNADFGDITLTGGHKLALGQAGTVIDNAGNVTVNFGTSGNVGNITATTTTGNINNALVIQGNAGNITYTAGAAVVAGADLYGGAVGDLARWGSITANQTIWGTRGVTTLETAGQKADGTATTLDFTVNTVNYKLLPGGTIDAKLNYAGASTATGDAFIAKTGGGNASIQYNIIGNDDNADGLVAITEIGHGGNVMVSSISGDIDFAGGTNLPDYTHVATLGNVSLMTGTFASASGLLNNSNIGSISLGFSALDTTPGTGGAATVVNSTGGFEGSVGNITATTTAGNITVAGLFGAQTNVNGIIGNNFANPTSTRFDGKVGDVTLTTGAVAHSGGVAVGNIDATAGVDFNVGQGLVKATTTDVGTIAGTFRADGPQAATGNGFEFMSQYGAITVEVAAGWYDYNNNGLFTADEFGRTGDLSFVSSGGALNITLNSDRYTSPLEQSVIGNVTATNTAYIDVKNGANDVIGTGKTALGSPIVGASGNITITGAGTQVGAVGNLVGNTNVGTIVHTGLFGDLGTATFKTTSYSDTDTNPNTTTEAPVLLASGNVQLGAGFNVAKGNALQVNGKHGLATYEVTENGTIAGTAYYGGQATGADSLMADSVRGNISLAVWLQDADQDGSGTITSTEFGTHGTAKLNTTSGGDITLALGTDQNNAAVFDRNLVSEFKFGAITAKTNDRYTSTSTTGVDPLADPGNITITGVGADASTNIAGLNAPVLSATANDVLNQLSLTTVAGLINPGDSVGPVRVYGTTLPGGLTAGTDYFIRSINSTTFTVHPTANDASNNVNAIDITSAGTNVSVAVPRGNAIHRGDIASITADSIRGNIILNGGFGSVGDQMLTATRYVDTVTNGPSTYVGQILYAPGIYGTHGTATLRTDDTGFGGTAGTPNGGAITGTAIFGGALADGKTVSVDAKSGRANIVLDVFATGYDVNSDGKITDGVNNNVPGDFEFAKVGNLIAETTNGGDVTLGVGTYTKDGSTIGSSIGNVMVTANDDRFTVNANALDTVPDPANATVVGKSVVPLTGGTVGDISILVGVGDATLQGNFGTIGGVSITTGTYTDASSTGGLPAVIFAGDILLGGAVASTTSVADTGGFTSLNIAGGYNDSVLNVTQMGTITGSVYVAGSGGKTWTLNAEQGGIGVGFIAGFDADGSGGALSASEAGNIGAIVASSSNHGNVTVGVGGRQSSSVVGPVTVSTGDTAKIVADGADTFVGTSGNATITGLSGGGLGSVGALTATVKTGVATLNGIFGAVGNVNYTTDAYIDADTAAGAGEEPVVIRAGDIFLGTDADASGTFNAGDTGLAIWGAHGTLNLTTVDSSKLAAGKSALPGTVGGTGDINGAVSFSGGLASGVTDGILAKTDRGNVTLGVTAGIDEDAGNDQDPTDAGTVGAVSLTSIDGDLALGLNVRNSSSSIGAVTLNTGSTYQAKAEAADVLIATGTATITSANTGPNAQNYGSVGNVLVNTVGGDINVSGTYNNLGTVTLMGGAYVDVDTAVGGGEPPVTLGASDLILNVGVRGTHNTFTLTAIDNSTTGAAFGGAAGVATVNATLNLTGSLAAGSTKTLVATSQQGTITSSVTATHYLNIADGVASIAVNDATKNTDDRIGVAGAVELTSLFNDVGVTLVTTAPVAAVAAGESVRTASIGSVLAQAGSSYSAVAAGADTLINTGDVTITNNSLGSIGSITGTTTGPGNVTLQGTASNVIGAIALSTGTYADADPAGTVAAGSITYSTAYTAQLAAAALGVNPALAATGVTGSTVSLTAGGSLSGTNTAAGSVTVNTVLTSLFNDADADSTIDAGELLGVSFGATTATVTDGAINYSPTVTGNGVFGVALSGVTLSSTGSATVVGSGNITIGGGGNFSTISNVSATAGTGDVVLSGSYIAPTISDVTLRSSNGNGATPAGNVTLSGTLSMGLQNVLNNRTANVSINNVTLQADNGNVVVSGTIGEAINYGAGNLTSDAVLTAAALTSDNRTATITNVNLVAQNGATDDGAADGNVTISGKIGGEDVTRIDQLGLVAASPIDDKTTFTNAVSADTNIEAWNIGKIATKGTTVFANGVALSNILAADDSTSRQLVGTVNYKLNSDAITPGFGSNTGMIDELFFEGAVIGGTNSYTTGTSAEVVASKIGNVTVNANVDPTSSTVFSVQNLDIVAVPQIGELIAQNAAAATLSGYKTLDYFSMGNIAITHNLQGASLGSAVFAGSSAFVAGGKMGDLTITSTLKGSIQAPMFAAAAGNAWFNVGDINGTLAVANTEAFYATKTTDGAVLVAMPTAQVSIGKVTVDVGSSYIAPAIQVADIGFAQGFAVAVAADVNAAGNYYGAAGQEAVAIDSTGARDLTGLAGAISIANNAIRPDNYNIGAEPANTAARAGAVVVAGDGNAATDEISDMVNELQITAIRPMNEGEYYLVGDDDLGGDTDESDVVVYVI